MPFPYFNIAGMMPAPIDIEWFEDTLFHDLLASEWWKVQASRYPNSDTWLRNCARCAEHDIMGFNVMALRLREKHEPKES